MNQQCVIVTGASRGIGAAIARALSEAGYFVACLSRSGATPSGTVEEDVRARWICSACDVTDRASITRSIAEIAAHGVPIVGLVNNAGIHIADDSHTCSMEDWRFTIDTNATSVLLACQSVFPHLVANAGGLIVNIGSFFDKLGVKRNLAYCASKAAVGAMTRCLAVEWADKGIQVVNVAPGYIQTDLNRDEMDAGPLRAYLDRRIPRRSPGDAGDVAEVVEALFRLQGRFLTGETIYLDGAQGVSH